MNVAKGNSVFCSHARLKAKFATPAALGAKLRTSSTPHVKQREQVY